MRQRSATRGRDTPRRRDRRESTTRGRARTPAQARARGKTGRVAPRQCIRVEFKRAFESGVLPMPSRPVRKALAAEATSADTKTRIHAAAERLFVEHGFEATSLRQLTPAAGVNLAAVNYHFGSKEELFQAVLTRRLDPMNQERIERLEKLEREAGERPASCEKVLF